MKFELPRTLIVAAASALLLSACASNLVHRGAVIDVSLANTIQPGVDNKASVTKLLGSPTFVGQFQPDSWYYVSRSTRTSALHNPSLTRNLVVKVQFDAAGNVASIGGTGKELVMNVDPSNRQTPTLGRKSGFFQNLFSNIGQVGSGGLGGPSGPSQ